MHENTSTGILVSVIIPTYNRKQKLVDTIRWICRSEFDLSRLEILIIDDCSTDGTETLSWKEFPVETLYFRQNKNAGPAAARNSGVKRARGQYLYFTDDDCLVPPQLLGAFFAFLQANPGVAGVGGGLKACHDNWVSRIETFKDRCLGIRIRPDNPSGDRNCPAGFTNNMMYRRQVFDEVGTFDENFKVPAGEDVELANRVRLSGWDLATLPVYVQHNHEYDLNYLLGSVIKQGLDRIPPSGVWHRLSVVIILLPVLIATVLRKVYGYRANRRNLLSDQP